MGEASLTPPPSPPFPPFHATRLLSFLGRKILTSYPYPFFARLLALFSFECSIFISNYYYYYYHYFYFFSSSSFSYIFFVVFYCIFSFFSPSSSSFLPTLSSPWNASKSQPSHASSTSSWNLYNDDTFYLNTSTSCASDEGKG